MKTLRYTLVADGGSDRVLMPILNQCYLPIVPVRMTEAWLLSSESAIRRAASNPNGRTPLDLPPWNQWEKKPDPKEILFQALRTASGRHGRRLNGFSEQSARHRVAELTRDFSSLERLEAFCYLKNEVNTFIAEWKEKLGNAPYLIA